MNDAARTEEQKRFEEGVGHEVENAGGKSACAKREKHVTELADGGVGEDFLDVVLHQRHGGCKNRGDHADDGDNVHRQRSELVDGVHAHDHVNAGGDHGGRVD